MYTSTEQHYRKIEETEEESSEISDLEVSPIMKYHTVGGWVF
jgi:hypothetical protein